ncbi:MAG: carbohydrate ABC transporter permease [Candidatus Njordarchaeales archaeon]
MSNTRLGRQNTGPLLVFPIIILLFFVFLFPTVYTFLLSFSKFSLSNSQQNHFIGLDNYIKLVHDYEFGSSLWVSVLFTGVTVPLELAVGLAFALFMNRTFRGRGIIRTVVLFPWAIPTALNAIVWRWLYNTDYGLYNDVLMHLKIIAKPINWLGVIPLAMIAMMIVAIWKTNSFMMLLLLAGLQSIPEELYDAAEIDGAGRWGCFKGITLPLLKPAILVALIFRSADAFRAFELPFNLTQGGPYNSTETLSVYAYKLFFQFIKFDYGSAVAITQFICLFVLGLFYIRALRIKL